MSMKNYFGASYISVYLGVSLTSIHNWRNDTGSGFPEPVASITGITGMRATFGWHKEQLPELRSWYANRFKLDETTTAVRWKVIDEELASGTAHEKLSDDECAGQYAIFSIPSQRTP